MFKKVPATFNSPCGSTHLYAVGKITTMQEATTFFAITIITMVAMMGFGWYKARQNPENKGLEPGAILIKFILKYPLTLFISLQLIAMVSEAALLASIQEKDLNVSARMTVHMFIALVSALGAFMMTKYIGSFVSVWFLKEPPAKKFGLIVTSLFLALISLLFTIGSPIFNLYAMAGSLKQGVQLEIYMNSVWASMGLVPDKYVAYLLAKNHLPQDYSPWQNLHPGVMTALALSTAHLLITFWETLVALTLALKNDGIHHAILGEFFDSPPREEAGKKEVKKEEGKKEEEKKEQKEEKKEEPKEDEKKLKDALKKLFTNYGLKEDKINDFTTKLVPFVFTKDSASTVANVAKITNLVHQFDNIKKSGGNVDKLREDTQKLVSELSNKQLTLPKN